MGLTTFEGHEVYASGIEMPGASGGLNKALRVDEMELHHGDRVTIVVDCEVTKVRFDPVKDTDGLERVHVLRVLNASTIDESVVRDALDDQARRVEAARGVHALPGPGEDGYNDDADPDAADPDAD
jgi:hypothetical protein